MKKLFYSLATAFVALCATNAHAQYHITTHTFNTYPDSMCTAPYFSTQTSGFISGMQIETQYGDGTSDTNNVMSSFVGGYTNYLHAYSAAGMYTIKEVLLLSGGSRIDSVVSSYDYRHCQTLCLNTYNDANSNCVFDSATESYIMSPMSVAVDSNGVRIDTFVVTSGLRYHAYGNPGDIYAFHIINLSPGLIVTCPSTGIIYDTISTVVNTYLVKEIALNCSGVTGYDAAEIVSTRAGRHTFMADMIISNQYCTSAAVTVTMNMSPKYDYTYAVPVPTSVVGHTLTWTFPALSALNPQHIFVHGEVPSTWLLIGDTVQSSYYVTPVAGDADPSNNTVILVDTVTGSFDPNDKTVSPKGYIPVGNGTKLTYTLRFENTGNDTAMNIHIMDTLSDNIDAKSIAILGSSAVMDFSMQNNGTHNIAKFDFPNINLLDSTHHGKCGGMVTFTANTKNGLVMGTHIDNRAGIYFDYNPVVMTNTVTNIVGLPDGVEELNNVQEADINVYPNPASTELTINIAKGAYSTVSIINSVGQEVMKQSVSGASTRLNVKALPAGSYYVTVRGNSGVKLQRFQKMQ